MPRVAYSEEDRERIRAALMTEGLALMARQGVQHTTVEQIYQAVGISRTFFYSFFPSKEDFVVEALYLQQPRIIAYARKLMEDPELTWREGVRQFLHTCCYGERNGIAILSIEEQQAIFRRLSQESNRLFREKQMCLFKTLLACFGVEADRARIALFTNLVLSILVVRRAIPDTLPLFVPEAADQAVEVQIEGIIDCMERMKMEQEVTAPSG